MGPPPPEESPYDRVRIEDEGRRMAPLDRPHASDLYQARENGPVPRAQKALFNSEPVSNEMRMSKYQLERADESPAGTAYSKDTCSKRRSTPTQGNRGQLQTHPLPATASSHSEGSDDKQSAREASVEILEISTSPLNVTPFDRGALADVTVPHDAERLLPWQDDQAGFQASPLTDSRRGRVLVDNSDIILDPKVQPTQSPLNADEASPDDDGIRIIPIQDHPQQDDDGASIRLESRVSSSGDSRHVKGTDNLTIDGLKPAGRYTQPPERLNEILRRTKSTNWNYKWDTRERKRERRQKAPQESSGLISFPFFTWRVKQGTE